MNIDALNAILGEKLSTRPDHLSPDAITQHHKDYIDYHLKHNPDNVIVIPIEEMSELTQCLCKLIRQDTKQYDTHLLEELADVEICIENLKMYLNIDDEVLRYIKDIKLERAGRKIKDNTM